MLGKKKTEPQNSVTTETEEDKKIAEMVSVTSPIGVDTEEQPPRKTEKIKAVKKGSLYCFVAMFLIAASVLTGMICSFTVKGLTNMMDIINIVMLLPQFFAYSFIAVQAYAWVSHRSKGVKIAFWIACVIAIGCLVAQLGFYVYDIAAKASAK